MPAAFIAAPAATRADKNPPEPISGPLAGCCKSATDTTLCWQKAALCVPAGSGGPLKATRTAGFAHAPR
jgi:hypothetical protein